MTRNSRSLSGSPSLSAVRQCRHLSPHWPHVPGSGAAPATPAPANVLHCVEESMRVSDCVESVAVSVPDGGVSPIHLYLTVLETWGYNLTLPCKTYRRHEVLRVRFVSLDTRVT